jgi:hypothetical protein
MMFADQHLVLTDRSQYYIIRSSVSSIQHSYDSCCLIFFENNFPIIDIVRFDVYVH